jgi:hypothetical protein
MIHEYIYDTTSMMTSRRSYPDISILNQKPKQINSNPNEDKNYNTSNILPQTAIGRRQLW